MILEDEALFRSERALLIPVVTYRTLLMDPLEESFTHRGSHRTEGYNNVLQHLVILQVSVLFCYAKETCIVGILNSKCLQALHHGRLPAFYLCLGLTARAYLDYCS